MMLFDDSIKSEHRCCPPTTPNLGCPLQDKIDRPYNNGNDDDDDVDDDDDIKNR
jgi:hypothetical protein